ncbi:MAG: diguanylate cyclase [Planctomycetota bacterium]
MEQSTPTLLVIDDSPAIHRLLAVKLRDEGIEFIAALGGTEGIEIARNQKPSLILCDQNMPDMNGLEVVRALKSDPATMDIPLIMLSGEVATELKVKAFELGAMDFVPKPFDAAELRARIQSALRIDSLMKMLAQRAQIDGLTGLWNRARFNDALAAEVNQAERSGQTLSLALCDLDHFKKLNDTFGHQAGDAALVTFANKLQTAMRSYDVACRYGGEEFALILPGTEGDAAFVVCDRIRTSIEATSWSKYPGMAVTVSFGLTNSGLEGNTPEQWVAAADQMLYTAKENGRNRIELFSPERQDIRLAG